MLPISKILCPTDFSEPSFGALDAAVELAGHFKSRLYLVHVVAEVPRPGWATPFYPAPETYAMELQDYEQAMRRNAERKLHEVAERHRVNPVIVDTAIGQGDAATEIVRIADTERVDLIVIATHGLTGWRHLVYGSVTEKVLRLAHCPVLTIRSAKGRD
ncbi:MAG TPA: universal stress protein [Blastocatellia bacterium]|nr:universal stress protein [Blastocatellia bacterium]